MSALFHPFVLPHSPLHHCRSRSLNLRLAATFLLGHTLVSPAPSQMFAAALIIWILPRVSTISLASHPLTRSGAPIVIPRRRRLSLPTTSTRFLPHIRPIGAQPSRHRSRRL